MEIQEKEKSHAGDERDMTQEVAQFEHVVPAPMKPQPKSAMIADLLAARLRPRPSRQLRPDRHVSG
jgi:hypothetical protein